MSKKKNNRKGTALDTGRLDERMWRIHQRASKFTPATTYNRKNKSWKKECA
jgi:hypothetical protein